MQSNKYVLLDTKLKVSKYYGIQCICRYPKLELKQVNTYRNTKCIVTGIQISLDPIEVSQEAIDVRKLGEFGA